MSGVLFVIVDQTAEAANEDWVFPGRGRSRALLVRKDEGRGNGGTGVRGFK
jgi:hypothetical protein